MLQSTNTPPNANGHNIWKTPFWFIVDSCWSHEDEVIGGKVLLAKPIKFGIDEQRILSWSILTKNLIVDFCLFLGYWLSKKRLLDHSAKGKVVSSTKLTILCTDGKRILC